MERALTEIDSKHFGADFAYISTINACNNTHDSIIDPTLQIRKYNRKGSPGLDQGHKGNKQKKFEVGDQLGALTLLLHESP